MIEDPTIFNDIADAINTQKGYNIQAAFIEKDYYAVQLLSLVNSLTFPDCSLIFAGGTCLAKAYQNTCRISEDLDIKFSSNLKEFGSSDRKRLRAIFLDLLEKSDYFRLLDKKTFNQYQTQIFEIQYPKNFSHSSLRDHLKLELVESKIYGSVKSFPVSSIYAEELNKSPEVSSIDCVNTESIIVEKLIALLWRTSALSEGININDDKALVRHIYDINLLISNEELGIDVYLLKEFFIESLKYQSSQYKSKYPEFYKSPNKVLEHGFNEIRNNPKHKERYEQMLLPLIYSEKPPAWEQVLTRFEKVFFDLCR